MASHVVRQACAASTGQPGGIVAAAAERHRVCLELYSSSGVREAWWVNRDPLRLRSGHCDGRERLAMSAAAASMFTAVCTVG